MGCLYDLSHSISQHDANDVSQDLRNVPNQDPPILVKFG